MGEGRPLFICDNLLFPHVAARVSEALILRTYPLKEADLVVSFLTRDQGKLRGVAKRARRPKGGFGAGLERLSYVRAAYFQREARELVNLDSCELIRSQFSLVSDYQASVALDGVIMIDVSVWLTVTLTLLTAVRVPSDTRASSV